MKTWNTLSFYFILIFLIVTVVFISVFKVSFGILTTQWTLVLAAIPYLFFTIMLIWVNKIINKKEEKIRNSEKAIFLFSNFSRPSLEPNAACDLIMKLIDSLGKNWWQGFGKEILSKLFYERRLDNAEKIKYLQDFIKEAASPMHKKDNLLLPMIFSVVEAEELAQVLAGAYYIYAINLIGGTVKLSAENITKALKNNQQISEDFLRMATKYAKEIMAESYKGDSREKVLGIIEGEITKAGK